MYINLNESDPQNAFYRCFDAKLQIADLRPEGEEKDPMGAVLQALVQTCEECLGRREDPLRREVTVLRETVNDIQSGKLCCCKTLWL